MGKKIMAKFSCESVTTFSFGQRQAVLRAVTGKKGEMDENASFNKATPSGELKITIDNPAAVDFFQPGKEYYLDFEEAPSS
jgi:hypothetical protein